MWSCQAAHIGQNAMMLSDTPWPAGRVLASHIHLCAGVYGPLPQRRSFNRNRMPEMPQVMLAALSLPISAWQMRTPSIASVLQESAPAKSQMSLSMVPPPNTIGGR